MAAPVRVWRKGEGEETEEETEGGRGQVCIIGRHLLCVSFASQGVKLKCAFHTCREYAERVCTT